MFDLCQEFLKFSYCLELASQYRSLDAAKRNPGDFRGNVKPPDLQNTSLCSALRASQRLFKFDPIEFSHFVSSRLRCCQISPELLLVSADHSKK